MIGWLYRMIVGRFHRCSHRWDVVRQSHGRYVRGGGDVHTWTLRCTACGEMKNHCDDD